jgi:hypothetical protein
MNPNIDMLEQFTREHRQTLLREAEQKRKATEARQAPLLNSSRRLTARLGKYLILVGTRLQRAQAVE